MSETLSFGYNAGLPEGTTVAWGARAIVKQTGSFDLVPDRQGSIGAEEEVSDLLRRLDRAYPMRAMAEQVESLLRTYEMRTSEAEEFTLYEGEGLVVKANTNASYGYLYLVAYEEN